MIVKMKKVSLIVLEALKVQALEDLKVVGLVHLETRPGTSEELSELEEKKSRLERSLLLLPLEEKTKKKTARPEPSGPVSCLDLAKQVSECVENISSAREESGQLQREADRLAVWGDFDPEEIGRLKEKGIDIRLYELTADQYGRLPEDIMTFIINRKKNLIRLAAVLVAGGEIPGLEEFPLPRRGLSQLNRLIAEKNDELKRLNAELEALVLKRPRIEAGIKRLENSIEFERARVGMGVEEKLAYLTGYVPLGKVDDFKKAASINGWAVLIDDPKEDDPAPTLVENPKWIRIIRPVFELLGTVPGYREYDISLPFLLFFSLFFAMLIGDAGYGLLFLGFTIFARIKLPKAPSGPFFLMFILSICTVFWGALSGTWFGVEALSQNRFLSRLILPGIASFGVENTDTIMLLCFIIGAVHISIAHLWSFLTKLPALQAFAQLGWLSVIWGLYFVIKFIVLRMPLNMIGIWLVLGGLLVILLFAEQRGNFFKGLGTGLAKFLLKLLDGIGAFSDIISYVRLFAVGLATVEVARSFNEMAAGIGFDLPIGLLSALILFFGHLLNIMMGALSVIVHGVRLNMLEFSGQLGMEWTGIPYDPFRHRIDEKNNIENSIENGKETS